MPSKICLYPVLKGPGGPTSFQARLASGLKRRGIEVTANLDAEDLQAILLVGGSHNLAPLWRARRRGIRIIQRLNGMNWIHRKRRTGLRHFLRAEYGNYLLAITRKYIAQAMVYQSKFSQVWWQKSWGPDKVPAWVIHNAVDLAAFSPVGPEQPPGDRWRLLVVEGKLGGGYEWGLEAAVGLANGLAASQDLPSKPIELVVAGEAEEQVQQAWQARCHVPMYFTGWIPRTKIPALDRSAHLLYAADIHPACPNSVIEALSCGLPVLAFDTGAMSELLTPDSGRLVAYGGDPWNLEPPDVPGLVRAALEILVNQQTLRKGAREQAEAAFDLEQMVGAYERVLMG